MAIQSMRIPILDAIYAVVGTMNIANGFVNDWTECKSLGNGTSTLVDGAQLNASFSSEFPSPQAGQSQYYLSMPVVLTIFKEYNTGESLTDQDYVVQVAKSSMIEDIRRAFGVPSSGMCSVGVTHWTYTDEIDTDVVIGNRVMAKLEFQVEWRDRRI